MTGLDKLLLFRDVVDAGGFSHAASRRGLSHSTVSKHVKSLESELGALLLRRTSRTMSLTEAGKAALACCRRIGGNLDELHESLDALRGEVVGELRVSSVLHVATHLVQPAAARFVREFPRARVALVLDDGPLHFSRDGFDLAVRVGLHVEGSLTASKLLSNAVCIVAAPSLLERTGVPKRPEDLAQMPAVAYRSADFDISAWPYRDGEEVRTVEVRPALTVNDGNALLAMVLSGAGVGYVSRFAALPHLRSGALVELLPNTALPPFEPVYIIQATTEHRSLKLEAFKTHLRALAAEQAEAK